MLHVKFKNQSCRHVKFRDRDPFPGSGAESPVLGRVGRAQGQQGARGTTT